MTTKLYNEENIKKIANSIRGKTGKSDTMKVSEMSEEIDNISTEGTTDYEKLENKPQINDVELTGDKTSSDLKLQGELTAGENITISDDNTISATGELSLDYEKATNKPKINDVELTGDKSSDDLELQGKLKAGDNINISDDNTISATGELSLDYEKATNKPQINSIELTGDKSSSDLGLQGELEAGDNITIDENNRISATGGSGGSEYTAEDKTIIIDNTNHTIKGGYEAGENIDITDNKISATGDLSIDYEKATNKPQINKVELNGNKTGDELGLQDKLVAGINIELDDNVINSTPYIAADDTVIVDARDNSIKGNYEAGDNIQIEGKKISSLAEINIDYEKAANKPQINSNELIGDKTSEDLGLQDKLTPGFNIDISDEGVIRTKGEEYNIKYEDLVNKPQINDIELNGNKSDIDLDLQHKLTAGQNITISDDYEISAATEVGFDYETAINKPKINKVELNGDKTGEELGLQDKLVPGINIEMDDNVINSTPYIADDDTVIVDARTNSIKGNYEAGDNISIEGNVINSTTNPYSAEDDTISIDNTNFTIKGNYESGDNISIEGNKINATGGDLSVDYEKTTNKPQINGNELIGDKTGADLGLQDKLTAGVGTYIKDNVIYGDYHGDYNGYIQIVDGNIIHLVSELLPTVTFTGEYRDLLHKAEIDGNILNDTSTSDGLGLQKKLTAGDNIDISEDNVISATAGEMSVDYDKTVNKPKINGNELIGDKTGADLGLQDKLTAGDNITIDTSNKISAKVPTKTSELTNDSDYITSSYHDSTKQDVISDLSTIRSKSNTALQPKDNISNLTNDAGYITSAYHDATKQNIISDLDTIRSKSNSALQPKDNISYLTNDSGYITSDYHDSTKQDKLTAGDNIVIDANNRISATGGGEGGIEYLAGDDTISIDNTNHTIKGSYVAGENIDITGNKISATGDLSVDYEKATNKPSINDIILSGDKTSSDLKLQGELTAGDNIVIDSNNRISATGGGEGGYEYVAADNTIAIDNTNHSIKANYIAGANISIQDNTINSDYYVADNESLQLTPGGSTPSGAINTFSIMPGYLSSVATSGKYSDLSDIPKINDVELSGDKTSDDLKLQGKLTAGDNIVIDSNNRISATGGGSGGTYWADELSLTMSNNTFSIKSGYLSSVATSGNYWELNNLPSIPSKTSELTNDSDYITSSYHDWSKQDVLTAGDNITIDSNNKISASVDTSKLVDLVYPVGSIYMSVNDVDPATLFGGSWDKIEDSFLLSSGTQNLGDSGGSADAVLIEHTHTQNQHSHTTHDDSCTFLTSDGNVAINSATKRAWASEDKTNGTHYVYCNEESKVIKQNAYTDVTTATNQKAGNSDGVNANLPPYLVVNMWQRTE